MLGRSDAEILSHVRRALRDIGEERFTTAAYRDWRQRELARHDRPIPALHQLQQRYGSLTEAVQLAQPTIARRRLRLAGQERIRVNALAATTPNISAPFQTGQSGNTRSVNDSPRSGTALDPDTAPNAAASHVALVVAMAETLTPEELQELERLLRRRLAQTPHPAGARRVKRLGALAQLLEHDPVITKPFPLIARKTYDERKPPDAPSSDTLQRIYGSWVKACRAASGVKKDGRKAGPGARSVPIRVGRDGKSPSYTREEVIAAVHQCTNDLGRERGDLSSHEYHEWVMDRAGRLRAQGQSHRLPHYGQITRLFRADAEAAGTTIWAAVLTAAT